MSKPTFLIFNGAFSLKKVSIFSPINCSESFFVSSWFDKTLETIRSLEEEAAEEEMVVVEEEAAEVSKFTLVPFWVWAEAVGI